MPTRLAITLIILPAVLYGNCYVLDLNELTRISNRYITGTMNGFVLDLNELTRLSNLKLMRSSPNHSALTSSANSFGFYQTKILIKNPLLLIITY